MSIEAERRWLMILLDLARTQQYAIALREAKRLRNLRGPYK